MKIELGKRFWLALTAAILILTFFVVGRNFLHAVRLNRQINRLEREAEMYRARIAEDSLLIEQLRYDDYLEQYAREHYNMQKPGEKVYIIR